jgi:Rrf2 family protein
MLVLAARYESPEPVRIRSIAEAHDIPSRFLVQILLQLKGAGYVASTRGAAGGYRLIKPPETITLADVMCVFEPSLAVKRIAAESSTAVSSTLNDVWAEAAESQLVALQSVTFADLVERVQGRVNNMYYI